MRSNIMKILIINPFGIGDVLFSMPLLRNLHNHYPEAQIYYLCNKRVAPLLESHPLITQSFIYEKDDFKIVKKKSLLKWMMRMLSFFSSMRCEHISVSVDLSMNTKYGFFSWCAGIKKRIGLDYKKRGFFLTHKLKCEGFLDKHVAEYHLDLLRFFNAPITSLNLELYISDADKEWANTLVSPRRENGRKIVGIAPFGGESFGSDAYIKRWPIEHFAQLINKIIDSCDAHVLLLAGPQEQEETLNLIAQIERKENVVNACEYDIRQIAALVDMCDMVIANDTGPLRFANALGKKIVALFGPVDEKVYGLYPKDEKKYIEMYHNTSCRPCYRKFRLSPCERNKECLEKVTVEDVYRQVAIMLKKEVTVR